MENIKEFYIYGFPLDTEIGKAHFVRVKEYPEFVKYIPYLELEKFEVINSIAKLDKEVAKEMKQLPFIAIIYALAEVAEFYKMYKEMFEFIFKEDVFYLISTDEEFEYYRELIRTMNVIQHENKNPNPEIQRFNDLKKLYDKSKNGGGITYEAIYTSVWLTMGVEPSDMTIYQLYANFNRLAQFKNYDTTTLYNTVSGEIDIDAWYKHIDVTSQEGGKQETLEQFSRNAKSIINEK